MSEEIKPKKFMLIIDEINMAIFARVFPCIHFVEVDGMNMTDNKDFMLIVNPVKKEEEVKDVIP